jgi:hypothetical protein
MMSVPSSPRLSRASSPDITEQTNVELRSIKNPEFKRNGKTYEIISIQRRVGENGEFEEVDLTKLTDEEINAFIQEAEKVSNIIDTILNGTPDGLKNAHSFSLHFTHSSGGGPGLLNATLGRVFTGWAWKEEPFMLNKITYKETEGSEEKTFNTNISRYEKEQQDFIHASMRNLNVIIHNVASRTLDIPLKLNAPAQAPVEDEPAAHAPAADLIDVNNDNNRTTSPTATPRVEVLE